MGMREIEPTYTARRLNHKDTVLYLLLKQDRDSI